MFGVVIIESLKLMGVVKFFFGWFYDVVMWKIKIFNFY